MLLISTMHLSKFPTHFSSAMDGLTFFAPRNVTDEKKVQVINESKEWPIKHQARG